MVSDFTVNRSIEFEYKRIMKDAQKRQQEEITNAILIVAVLIILLIMAAGAEGIHESFRKTLSNCSRSCGFTGLYAPSCSSELSSLCWWGWGHMAD
jgi:hypothetical protein